MDVPPGARDAPFRRRRDTMFNRRSPDVLLVEDDDIDAAMLLRATRTEDGESPIHWVADGSQALDFLRQHGDFAGSPRTDLVLLDLNLPGIDGHELLQIIKSDPALKTIPVVILTSSNHDLDVTKAYENCAAAFVKKPLGRDGYAQLVRAIDSFWLGLVEFPAN